MTCYVCKKSGRGAQSKLTANATPQHLPIFFSFQLPGRSIQPHNHDDHELAAVTCDFEVVTNRLRRYRLHACNHLRQIVEKIVALIENLSSSVSRLLGPECAFESLA